MMSRRTFKAFLAFNWYVYLIIFGLMFGIFYWVFESINLPTYDEKVVVFIAHKKVDEKAMSKAMYVNFDNTDILEVTIDYSNPDDQDFPLVFNTRGMVNTDIIIIKDDYINEGSYDTYFQPLNLIDLNEQYENLTYFYDEETAYGIECSAYLKKYCDVEGNYYLFFNLNSPKYPRESLIFLQNLLESGDDLA